MVIKIIYLDKINFMSYNQGMKLTLNQKFEYTLFGLSNLFFATPWVIFVTIIILGSFFQDPNLEHVSASFIVIWFALLVLKFVFVLFYYAASEDIRFLLDKFTPLWKLIGFALLADIVCFIVQYIITSTYNIKFFDESNITNTIKPYYFMLGGVTPSYLIFTLCKSISKFKKRIKKQAKLMKILIIILKTLILNILLNTRLPLLIYGAILVLIMDLSTPLHVLMFCLAAILYILVYFSFWFLFFWIYTIFKRPKILKRYLYQFYTNNFVRDIVLVWTITYDLVFSIIIFVLPDRYWPNIITHFILFANVTPFLMFLLCMRIRKICKKRRRKN